MEKLKLSKIKTLTYLKKIHVTPLPDSGAIFINDIFRDTTSNTCLIKTLTFLKKIHVTPLPDSDAIIINDVFMDTTSNTCFMIVPYYSKPTKGLVALSEITPKRIREEYD